MIVRSPPTGDFEAVMMSITRIDESKTFRKTYLELVSTLLRLIERDYHHEEYVNHQAGLSLD